MAKLSEVDALIAKYPKLIKVNGPECSVSASGHRELVEALSSRGLVMAAVHRILRAEGITVGVGALRRHRDGECKCPR